MIVFQREENPNEFIPSNLEHPLLENPLAFIQLNGGIVEAYDWVTSQFLTKINAPAKEITAQGTGADFDKTVETTAGQYFSHSLPEAIGTRNFVVLSVIQPRSADASDFRYYLSTSTFADVTGLNQYNASSVSRIGSTIGTATTLGSAVSLLTSLVYDRPLVHATWRNANEIGQAAFYLDDLSPVGSGIMTETRAADNMTSTTLNIGRRTDGNTDRYYDGVSHFHTISIGDYSSSQILNTIFNIWDLFEPEQVAISITAGAAVSLPAFTPNMQLSVRSH